MYLWGTEAQIPHKQDHLKRKTTLLLKFLKWKISIFFYTYLFDKQDIIGIEDQELIILPQLVEQI